MIDEATYNELKKYTEPQPHRDAWLSELGYIEATDLHVRQFRITAQGLLALREYEQYDNRNRVEDARHRDEYNRSIRIQKTAVYVAVIGVAVAVVSIVLSALQVI